MRTQTFATSVWMMVDIIRVASRFKKNKMLYSFYFFGYCTSLLNHGTEKRYFRVLDRVVMITGSCINVFQCDCPLEYALQCIATVCYFLTKLTGTILYHNVAHVTVSYLNNHLLLEKKPVNINVKM